MSEAGRLATGLPASWTILPAHEACEKIQDGTHFSSKVQLSEGHYRYVTAKNVRPRGLDLSDVTYLRDEDHRAIYSRCDTRKGDVLLVKDGVNAGDAALNTLEQEVSLLSSVCFLRPRQFLTGAFLRYYLLSPLGARLLTAKLTGTAIRRIVLRRVRDLPVVIAPLDQQDRVVAAIDSYLSRLDEAEAALARVHRNLKRYRAAVLQAAVEGRLVPTEAELARAEGRDYEPASELLKRILAERRRRWEEVELTQLTAAGKTPKDDGSPTRYRQPVRADPGALPALPEGWCWVSLDQLLVEIGAGKNFRCQERPPDNGEVGVVKVSAVSWGAFDESESKTCTRPDLVNPDHFIRSGDFLISRANTIQLVGACVIVSTIRGRLMLSDKILRLRLAGGIDQWILWVLRSDWGRKEIESLATGNQESMRNISQASLCRVRVPLPPSTECERIAALLRAQLSDLDNADVLAERTLHRCGRLRQSILKWAFEGKLVEQDPNDEPASVLLERIRHARERTRNDFHKARNARARKAR